MKKLSRIIAGLSTVAVMAVSAVSFSGSAAQTIRCNDPNADGVIDISDAITIRQYLAGGITPSNVDALDFDNNGVVTQMDAYEVQLYLVKLLNVQMNSSNPTAVSPQGDSSASYRVYNAKTGSEINSKRYTLTESPAYTNSRQIVGDTDDRVIDWSKNGVVKILNSDGSFGSGFVVGEHTIATAAHCVSGKKISKIWLFNNDGTEDFMATPIEYHVPAKYYSNDEYDYALITIEEDLSDHMQFDLGTVRDYSSSRNISVSNTGFPAYYKNGSSNIIVNDQNTHNMYTGTGSIVSTDNQYFCHSIDTTGGNSGSPVYYTETVNGQTYYTVIGIHVRWNDNGYNDATRINSELLRFYEYNPNIE